MISILIIVIAAIVLILRQFGIVKNPMHLFIITTIIMGASVFILKDKLNCPFAKKCPFTICPLNKAEKR